MLTIEWRKVSLQCLHIRKLRRLVQYGISFQVTLKILECQNCRINLYFLLIVVISRCSFTSRIKLIEKARSFKFWIRPVLKFTASVVFSVFELICSGDIFFSSIILNFILINLFVNTVKKIAERCSKNKKD